MTPEQRPNQTQEDKKIPDSRNWEAPLDGSVPIHDINNTGEIEKIVPNTTYEGFENLPPQTHERADFDQSRSAVRDSHEDMGTVTPQELELIRLHREGRLQTSVTPEAETTTELEPITLPDVTALTAGSKARKAETAGDATKPNRKPFIIGGAAVGLLATGAALIAGLAKGPSDDHRTAPIVSPVPTATGELTPSATATAQETAPAVKETILKQQTSIEAMETMSLDQFAKLSFADRFAYAVAKYPGIADGTLDDAEMVRQEPRYITATWQDISKYAMEAKNPLEGAKIFAGGQLYTTEATTGLITPEYKDAANTIMAAGGGVPITTDIIFEKKGEWQTGTDRTGVPIEFTNITYSYGNRNGTAVPDSQRTAQAVKVTVETLDGQKATTYPRGYGVKGVASPDDRYPY